MSLAGQGLLVTAAAKEPRSTSSIPSPPEPEPVRLERLPLSPGISNDTPGACTIKINPRGTGSYVGAPSASDPASVYNGSQIIIIKTDGSRFSNGDKWKCITCGVPAENAVRRTATYDYPQAFDDGKRIPFGSNIADCGNHSLISDECTPDQLNIYPIHWDVSADGFGVGGSIRELRLHPDNVHFGFSSFTTGAKLAQYAYFGRLKFNSKPTAGLPFTPRYDLINVYRLYEPGSPAPVSAKGTQLTINTSAISVGELRGFSGRGDEAVYVGYPAESCNLEIFAVGLQSGRVRRITSDPGYVDPIEASPDGKWWAIMDTRGTDRQTFLAGMRNVPPVLDLSDNYYGQKLNGPGSSKSGSGDLRDPEWNGQADPQSSPDSTQIVYWEAHVEAPACGGINPLPCHSSMEPDGKDIRIVLATLTARKPTKYTQVDPVPDNIPWAEPYVPGSSPPERNGVTPGRYTLDAIASGYAGVTIAPDQVAVTYHNYTDDGKIFLNGWENATTAAESFTRSHVDWYSNLTQSGPGIYNTKKTSADGFHITIDVLTNEFNANGTLTATIDGKPFSQPLNAT
ncbi:hypothetical protein NM208_g6205 [Fusarium decemcellulare]|uniref:Uncharacterized protein n=1 Tax=Fusarium decemcellulare TaxID=57161 RepID=A0ACC1SDX5_9HYPO|nr:hypothetical protein NM208_g6205 [Fusarium decemcellulare]